MVPPESLPLAAASGLFFAIIGVAYRYGEDRRTRPLHILLVASVLGAAFFGLRSLGQWTSAPPRVWLWGLAAAGTQYALVQLLWVGLRMGPLSPLWCAMMLGFVPIIVMASIGLGEPLTAMDLLAVAAASGCVVAGAFKERPGPENPLSHTRRWRRKLIYGLVLLAAMLLNSTAGLAMKYLNYAPVGLDGVSDAARYGDVFRASLYLALAGLLGGQLVVRRRFGAPLGWALGLGTIAGVGSVAGLWTLSVASAGPAALVFPLSNVVSILVASAASVTLFPERADRVWFATVGLGVLAAGLATWPALARLLGG